MTRKLGQFLATAPPCGQPKPGVDRRRPTHPAAMDGLGPIYNAHCLLLVFTRRTAAAARFDEWRYFRPASAALDIPVMPGERATEIRIRVYATSFRPYGILGVPATALAQRGLPRKNSGNVGDANCILLADADLKTIYGLNYGCLPPRRILK